MYVYVSVIMWSNFQSRLSCLHSGKEYIARGKGATAQTTIIHKFLLYQRDSSVRELELRKHTPQAHLSCVTHWLCDLEQITYSLGLFSLRSGAISS